MKPILRDTTDPTTYRQARALFERSQTGPSRAASVRLFFDIVGLFQSEVGPSWSSHGRLETDYFHHIHLAVAGSAEVIHNGKPLVLEAGWAYFLPGNTPVARYCREFYSMLFVKCRCEWIPGVDLLIDWTDRKPTRLGRWSPEDWMVPEQRSEALRSNVLVKWQGLLTLWFADAFPDLDYILQRQVSGHSRFAPVLERIERDLGADLRVEDLAKIHRTGLHAFSMAFERALGVNPKTYLNRRLNQEAIRWVINSDLPMKEIAATLRFSDECYFSRFFSKMNGLSPTHYRQSVVGKPP
ncbi:MAG: AraC family transcriptional regulator [Pseudomonadota bacterium]|nr:AraC family transcriptional regulator [Pseudomonadota bacterium]